MGMEFANTWNGEGDVDGAGLGEDQDFVFVHIEMSPGYPGGKGWVCLVTHIWKLSTYKCSKPGDLQRPLRGCGWRREGVKRLGFGARQP